MIADKLDNIELYKNIDKNIYEGLLFIKNASSNIELGEYKINSEVKAIITEYTTKDKNPDKFESHDYVIDIQYVIFGRELVQWAPLDGMNPISDYDSVKDRTFYNKPKFKSDIIIGDEVFAVFFKEDAHNPSLAVKGIPKQVKKITIKISH